MCCSARADPILRCFVNYAGSTQTIESHASQSPYNIASVNISDRFRFKAVMVEDGQGISYIKLYVYFQTRQNDLLIHQATYLPPFTSSTTPLTFTPANHLYAGEAERELQYYCTLQGA
ncbi:hypothetical protein BH11PSE12_BH11PSE12_29860 [soil metagenome]